MNHWLIHLAAIWNWGIKKIERDAAVGVYHGPLAFRGLLNGHGPKMGIPQDAINGTLWTAHRAWQHCFKGLVRKPRLKGRRNKLNSIAFSHGTRIEGNRVRVRLLGWARFCKQDIPQGHISQIRIVKRASGWYLCLSIKAEPNAVPVTGRDQIGIDPGFQTLLTISTGEKIPHPRELEASAVRLAQASRGNNNKLAGRIQERISNQRRDRNHKLSRRLVAENQFIAFSGDNHSQIKRRFGKSVASSGHAQLRQMLSYKSKCRTDGLGVYVEVDSRNSTKTCSTCGALTGPYGWAGLKVRRWTCAQCGAEHDRDVNAAINTLIVGAGLAQERPARVA